MKRFQKAKAMGPWRVAEDLPPYTPSLRPNRATRRHAADPLKRELSKHKALQALGVERKKQRGLRTLAKFKRMSEERRAVVVTRLVEKLAAVYEAGELAAVVASADESEAALD